MGTHSHLVASLVVYLAPSFASQWLLFSSGFCLHQNVLCCWQKIKNNKDRSDYSPLFCGIFFLMLFIAMVLSNLKN